MRAEPKKLLYTDKPKLANAARVAEEERDHSQNYERPGNQKREAEISGLEVIKMDIRRLVKVYIVKTQRDLTMEP